VNPIAKILSALRAVANHPLNRPRKLQAVLEYGFVQVAARLVPGDVCVEFPNNTRLLVSPRMKGAAHYIAPRLCEFEEMAFVMHFLRPGQLFADVGANVGAFTVLAAGVAGARAIAFEPSPDTYESLSRNIRLNGLQDRVRAVHAALGRSEGRIQLSVGLGTENFVAVSPSAGGTVSVRLTSLDAELSGAPPVLLKVDVEGYETEVFAGASSTLARPELQAIIVEKNDIGSRYGFDESALHSQIRQLGFVPCIYEPFARHLSQVRDEFRGNVIYVRDVSRATEILRAAPAFRLGELCV